MSIRAREARCEALQEYYRACADNRSFPALPEHIPQEWGYCFNLSDGHTYLAFCFGGDWLYRHADPCDYSDPNRPLSPIPSLPPEKRKTSFPYMVTILALVALAALAVGVAACCGHIPIPGEIAPFLAVAGGVSLIALLVSKLAESRFCRD